MKKIIFLTMALSLATFMQATVSKTVNVPTAGGLVTYIYNAAFYECSALTDINLPSMINSISASAFYSCTSLKNIDLPASLESIGLSAFKGCTSLLSINIPPLMTYTGDEAFSGCTELTTVTIPISVKSISSKSFYGCTKLTSVVIPDSVENIYAQAFQSCSGLSTINIPTSVSDAFPACFNGCTGLSSIFVYKSIPAIATSTYDFFYNVNKTTCILHVPIGSKSLYQAANLWNGFLNIVDDLPTEVINASATSLKVSTHNNHAIVSGISIGETISVYNLRGVAIYNQKADAVSVAVSLPKQGAYIVKVGAKSVKVVL